MTEHICRKCEMGNPYPPDTLTHARQELALTAHRLGWALLEELRIPRLVEWLNRKLTRR